MPPLEDILRQVGFHFAQARPFIPTYLHIICSALVSIYTGAHASLSIPKSAAKPPKRKRQTADEEEDEPSDIIQKMEGLSPSDAVMFPLLAGCTLAGLYFLIKWLDDPAVLNKILNWYFSVFGVLSVARLFTDAMGVGTSFLFPKTYRSNGTLWEIKRKQRFAETHTNPQLRRNSPFPGIWSKLPLPSYAIDTLWTLRELRSKKIHLRAYIHHLLEAHLHLGPQGALGFVLALFAVLYYNLIAKPWWLTNILGYSFAYTALQFMSPTTFSTGSLILGALFIYDIYFVFYTPMMVTVATKIDIPAKMLFPRPVEPGADPAKSLAMLGLGDIVLPGIVMGSALRFDLYMFYLKKQRPRERSDAASEDERPSSGYTISESGSGDQDGSESTNGSTINKQNPTLQIIKATFQTATGSWGERFWLGSSFPSTLLYPGVSFPKPYFHATLFGYTTGMLVTLSIMQIFGHAQPALFYLVPGVLISLWGTALIRGEWREMWAYDETEEDESRDSKEEGKMVGDKEKEGKKSIFSRARQDEIAKTFQRALGADSTQDREVTGGNRSDKLSNKRNKAEDSRKGGFFRDRKTELVFFSVNLPKRWIDGEDTQSATEEKGEAVEAGSTD